MAPLTEVQDNSMMLDNMATTWASWQVLDNMLDKKLRRTSAKGKPSLQDTLSWAHT